MNLRTCTQCGTTMQPHSVIGSVIMWLILGCLCPLLWIMAIYRHSLRHQCSSCKSKLTLPADQPAARAVRKRLGTELPKDLAKSAMIALLPLLLATAAIGAEVDPDDDTVPAPAPAVATPKPAPSPPHAQDPAQAASDAVHAQQRSNPAAKPAATAAQADPMRGGYPESVHRFFAARAAFEAEVHRLDALPPVNGSYQTSPLLLHLQKEVLDTDEAALNSWFSNPAHIPDPPKDGTTHQFWLECNEARNAIASHAWPCWSFNNRSGNQLIDMGCQTGKTYGPDWLDDMCDGAHRGSHRTN